MQVIEPFEGVVLVELINEFGDIPTVKKDHDSLTSGKVISVNKLDTDREYLVGRTVHWRKYLDDARLPNNQCFINIKVS